MSSAKQRTETAELLAPHISRRSLLLGSLAGLGVVGLGGCATMGLGADYPDIYRALPDERFPIPAADLSQIDPQYLRRVVRYRTDEEPGTIIIDPGNFYLYHIMEDGYATRYGANVGRAGFLWTGEAYIGRKAEWPIWTPTRDQIGRDPWLVEHAGGMAPGLGNPLGSRALYLYQDGVYTLYTIYGTAQEWTIGQGVSSGCVGLLNQDVIHLFELIPIGTKVIVLPAGDAV
ncbi:MAG: L,D-transpeptidase [Alphaproteobacteria bacterium]